MTSTALRPSAAGRAAPRRAAPPRQKLTPHRRKEALTFYLFISPWVIGFVVFLLGPMLFSIYLTFTEWDSFTAPVWVGLDNYITLLTDDPIFLRVMGNTAYYSLISVPLGMVVSLFIANLLVSLVMMVLGIVAAVMGRGRARLGGILVAVGIPVATILYWILSIVMGIVLAASGAVDASGELTASHFRLVYGVDIVRAVLMGAAILLGAFFVHSTAKKKLSA